MAFSYKLKSLFFLKTAGGEELHEGLRHGLQFPHGQHQERCSLTGGTTG